MITNFENKLTYNGISFQRSTQLNITEREIHNYHEILFCMDTEAVFFSENQQIKINGNTLFLIPKGKYHFFRVCGCTFPRLKIYFPDDILKSTPCSDMMREICIFKNVDGNLMLLLKKFSRILEEPKSEKQGFYAFSMFLMLLTELDRSALFTTSFEETKSNAELGKMIEYISEHLSENLSVTTLAKKTNLSESGISHLFKSEMGISVHRYITQRRLVYAQGLLLSGNSPSKIYSDCGYKDYSSFYKAYCLYFGYPPSYEGKLQ